MNYEDFKNEVAKRIKEFLPEKYADAVISIATVTKNNDQKLDGLMIKHADSNICPNIYLNSYFSQYEDGRQLEDILKAIVEVRISHEMPQDFDVSRLTNFDTVKERITCRLVNAEQNAEYLSDKPHTMIADLAVTYYVIIGKDGNGTMTAPVTNHLMEDYGVDAKTLHQIAKDNMESLNTTTFKSLSEVMIEMIGAEGAELMGVNPSPEEEQLYVLSNIDQLHGAAALLNDTKMSEINARFPNGFYILPSSVHEVLIVPKTELTDLKTLEDMVREINATQVALEDRLSDHVYAYDAKERSIVRADKPVLREAEKRPSLADKLAAAEQEVAAQAEYKGKALVNERG